MIRMQRQSPLWVKSGKARNEQIPSGLPPKADLRCALMSNVLLIYPPGCAARGCSQERLSSNSALVLPSPCRHSHKPPTPHRSCSQTRPRACSLRRLPNVPKRHPAFAYKHPGPRLIGVAWCLGIIAFGASLLRCFARRPLDATPIDLPKMNQPITTNAAIIATREAIAVVPVASPVETDCRGREDISFASAE